MRGRDLAEDPESNVSPLIRDSNAARHRDARDLRLILAAIFGAMGVMLVAMAAGLILWGTLYSPETQAFQEGAKQMRALAILCMVGAGIISVRDIPTLIQIGGTK